MIPLNQNSFTQSAFGKAVARMRSLLALLATTTLLAGCQSMWTPPSPSNLLSRLSGRESPDDTDRPDTVDGIVGPLQRLALSRNSNRNILPRDKRDHAALKVAQQQFDDGQYALAEKGFKAIAKKRSPSKFYVFDSKSRSKDGQTFDPIREEAVFYLAESQFMQNTLANAVTNYQRLVKDYPSTRFMDESTSRLFDISKRWLGVENFATTDEIRQVSLQDGADDEPLSTQVASGGFSLIPNLRDPSRPVFDQNGHALKALKTIWLNDPSGPLADDALMLAATHHLRNEKYSEADRLFTIIREQFSKSPHLQDAFVLGSHVKLMGYQGAAYDDQLLLDGRALQEQSLRLFPDLAEADRLRRGLQGINNEEAGRLWHDAKFWGKKRKPKAVAISCKQILENYPETGYAKLARAKLAELGLNAAGATTTTTQFAPATFPVSLKTPLSPLTEVPSTPSLQQIPEIRNRLPDPQNQQVFPRRQPIFDDDPVPNSDAGRVRL